MAQLDEIDLDSIPEGRGSFDPIPAGWYTAQITASEVAVTKSGNGKMLKLRFDIMEGEYESRVVWDQPCFQHTYTQTQTIALQRLKDICKAVGHTGPFNDSEVLHYKPLMIKVAVRPPENGYEAQNGIKAVKACGAPVAPARPVAAKSLSANAEDGKRLEEASRPARPWGNRK